MLVFCRDGAAIGWVHGAVSDCYLTVGYSKARFRRVLILRSLRLAADFSFEDYLARHPARQGGSCIACYS
jgi:hypothetical protein